MLWRRGCSRRGVSTAGLAYLREVPESTLLVLAAQSVPEACAELLVRDVMRVEGSSWDGACASVQLVEDACRKYDRLIHLPFHLFFTVSVASGLLAGPMVFNWRVAVWFDRNFVAMDLPDPHDVETTLEVGAWTWNYMEPILGTASFMLLAFQVARTQLMNAGLRPYRSFVYELRAQRVAREFPKYDERLVRDFAMQSARLCKLAHQQQS